MIGSDTHVRFVPCPGGNIGPQPSQQLDRGDTRGGVHRLGTDRGVRFGRVVIQPDKGDLDIQRLIEAGLERCVAQTKGCRIQQGRRSYQDRNENY